MTKRQQVSLGRIVHVWDALPEYIREELEGDAPVERGRWVAGLVTRVDDPNSDGGCKPDGSFVVTVLVPPLQMHEFRLNAADEGPSWRWPPHVPPVEVPDGEV